MSSQIEIQEIEINAKTQMVKKYAKKLKSLEEQAMQSKEVIGLVTKQLKVFAEEAVKSKEIIFSKN